MKRKIASSNIEAERLSLEGTSYLVRHDLVLGTSMRASVAVRANTPEEHLPKALPRIRLHHGDALWVLARLGFQGVASKSTFHEYIKSLRKLGAPFGRGTLGLGRRGLANYTYDHLMELMLVFTLRVLCRSRRIADHSLPSNPLPLLPSSLQ